MPKYQVVTLPAKSYPEVSAPGRGQRACGCDARIQSRGVIPRSQTHSVPLKVGGRSPATAWAASLNTLTVQFAASGAAPLSLPLDCTTREVDLREDAWICFENARAWANSIVDPVPDRVTWSEWDTFPTNYKARDDVWFDEFLGYFMNPAHMECDMPLLEPLDSGAAYVADFLLRTAEVTLVKVTDVPVEVAASGEFDALVYNYGEYPFPRAIGIETCRVRFDVRPFRPPARLTPPIRIA